MTEVQIPAGRAVLSGNLTIPENAMALVLFAHGSGSSRHSPRNQFVARTLNRAGLGTLLFDCSRLKRKRSTSTLVNTGLTLVCWPSALCTLRTGLGNKTNYAICELDISAQAQAALRRWSQQRNFHRTSVRSFPVVDVPIWLAMLCQKSKRRHCSSSAATMTLSSS